MNIKKLAQRYGANLDFVKREFKWWCRSRGVDPKQFLVRNGSLKEYQLPQEFLEHFDRVVRKDLSKRKIVKIDTL